MDTPDRNYRIKRHTFSLFGETISVIHRNPPCRSKPEKNLGTATKAKYSFPPKKLQKCAAAALRCVNKRGEATKIWANTAASPPEDVVLLDVSLLVRSLADMTGYVPCLRKRHAIGRMFHFSVGGCVYMVDSSSLDVVMCGSIV